MCKVFDISDFRLPEDDPRCHYLFAVILDTPKYDFNYDTLWQRLMGRFFGQKIGYAYFHKGQVVICNTDENGASPREVAWGGKPGKHDCTVEKFTDLAKAIKCAEDVINETKTAMS